MHIGIQNLVKTVDQQANNSISPVGVTATTAKIQGKEMSCYFWWFLSYSNIPGPEQKQAVVLC